MSQKTITSFFNSRKRAANDEIFSSKNKIAHLERTGKKTLTLPSTKTIGLDVVTKHQECTQKKDTKCYATEQLKAAERLPQPSEVFAKKVNATNVEKTNGAARVEAIASARKELSLGDIRKKLACSSRLAELRAKAESISNGIQKLKEESEKRNLKEFKSIDVELPAR